MTTRRTTRGGFTLIELLVSMALTLFIMLILTQAFTTSLDTFSRLKITGEMQGQLRNVASILQADLAADHFEGKRRLSDWRQAGDAPWLGFFQIRQGATPTVEGTDPDGISSCRATQDVLYFTAKLRGPRREQYFSAPINTAHTLRTNPTAGQYFAQSGDGMYQTGDPAFNSQWAEVAYFLRPTHTSPDGVQLHALYRAQYVLVPAKENVSGAIAVNQAPNLAGQLTSGTFYAPRDVASRTGTAPTTRTLDITTAGGPQRRDAMGTSPAPGATLLLANVVAFNVQAQTAFDGTFTNVANYDSATANAPLYSIKATIRIWEEKGQTRQITILQDL